MRSDFDMYYGATIDTQEKAKLLRKNETSAEKLLWKKLKAKQMNGCKFRRQHPIDSFIVDFYCHEVKMVIEVDGSIHKKPENKEYDIGRTTELEHFGIKVLRFTNEEVEKNIENVLEKIRANVQ